MSGTVTGSYTEKTGPGKECGHVIVHMYKGGHTLERVNLQPGCPCSGPEAGPGVGGEGLEGGVAGLAPTAFSTRGEQMRAQLDGG